MFKKWDDEFATGKMVDSTDIIADADGNVLSPVIVEEYMAGFGDLLEKFVEVRGSWWRRLLHPTGKAMREELNRIMQIHWVR